MIFCCYSRGHDLRLIAVLCLLIFSIGSPTDTFSRVLSSTSSNTSLPICIGFLGEI